MRNRKTDIELEEILEKGYLKKEYHGRTAKNLKEKELAYDLSFIIPVYNAESSIKQCVDSVIHQSESRYSYEIIMVNDGSTDRSLEILEKMQEENDNVTVVNQDNGGISVARNTGLQYAKGRYIAFIDNDDYIAPDYVKSLLDKAYETKADVVKCGRYEVKGERVKAFLYAPIETENLGIDVTKYSGYIWEGIVSRTVWEKIYFPEGYWYEDMISKILIYRYARKFVCVDSAFYYHVFHRNNASNKVWSTKNNQCLDQLYLPQRLKEYSDQLGIEDSVGLNKILIKEWGVLLYSRTKGMELSMRKAAFYIASSFLLKCEMNPVFFDVKEKLIFYAMKKKQFYMWSCLNKILF